ncbi:MAG: serine--tRNA ligase [Pseudomonadota bacterium]
MHDIRQIRENPEGFDTALAKRGVAAMSSEILNIDRIRREKITAAETALAERNAASKQVGAAKARGDETEFELLRALVSEKKAEITALEEAAKVEDDHLNAVLMTIPNLPHDDVPQGKDEADNVEIRREGVLPSFDFTPQEHFEILAVKGGMDFETAAKLSGSRFVVMSGAVARLHRALAQFMIDTHTSEHELTEVNAPVLVRDDAMIGTGQLPKFAEDSYQTTNGWWLIPTSEVTLTNLVSEHIIEEGSLPRRFTAHSLCFRSEAGSAGRDTTGMLRQHQFEKVEMVSVTKPENSREELDRMTNCAENILRKLGLAFRTVVLCTGDMGFGARRTHDIEVWLPGQDTYREISSCSVCGDFQARRMNARFRPEGEKKPKFLHTLNGSGLAVGRCLIAVLENGQRADGSVLLPEVLHTYLGGKTQITASGELI